MAQMDYNFYKQSTVTFSTPPMQKICEDCGKEYVTTSRVAKRCLKCREIRKQGGKKCLSI
jgi:hypothetical protein